MNDNAIGHPDVPAEAALPRISALTLIGPEGISGPDHLRELLRAATRQCRKLVDCETVRVWVSRRGGRRFVAFDFPDEGPPVERRLGPGEGLAGQVIASGASLRLGERDARPAGPRGGPGAREAGAPREAGAFRSALVIPLHRRGDAFGAIECLDKKGGDFTDADFDRLEVAAEGVAFAVDYALLYQEIERRALEKDVLLDIARSLSAPFDLDEVIAAIFQSLRQVVDYDAAAIYLVEPQSRTLGVVSSSGYPEGSEEAFGLQIGQGIVGWVAKTGEPVIVPDVAADRRYVAARPQTRSEVATPMVVEGQLVGVFNLESNIGDAYHEGHLELLSAFAAQAAVAVQRARIGHDLVERRRLERELVIARDIQRSFLPSRAPDVPGFDVAGTSIAHDEVGGDYFDYIPVSETRLGLAIADVSGKGIPAALIMAGFRMSLLAEIRNEFAIRAVMRKVNLLLHESTERGRFVTSFYGVLDGKHGVLIFSNAGHNPPMLVRRDGSCEPLTEGGLALGVLADSRYEERPVALQSGDVLVMYTDGVSEAENEHGELFGEKRLEDLVRANANLPAAEILKRIVGSVTAWAGAKGPNDDVTLIVVRKLD